MTRMGTIDDSTEAGGHWAESPLGRLRRGRVWLLILATAAGWQACFAPFDLAPLAYGVLVPWVVAVVMAGRRPMLTAYLSGLVIYGAALYWLTWVTMVGYPALILYLAVYWLAGAWFVRSAVRARIPLWIALPPVWVALEYARAYMLSGFPWFYLAHSQYRLAALVQIADVTGAYGISFVVALFNGLGADVVLRSIAARRGALASLPSARWIGAGFVVSAMLLASMLLYGGFRLDEADRSTRPGPRIAVAQSAEPISLYDDVAQRDSDFFDQLIEISRPLDGQVDLLVWPETVLPPQFDRHWSLDEPWTAMDPLTYDADARRYVLAMRRRHQRVASLLTAVDAPLLAGAMTARVNAQPLPGERPFVSYNSALLMRAASESELFFDGVYHKMHCVPFSEYVPFRDSAPTVHRALRWFVPSVMQQLTPGRREVRFRLAGEAGPWTFVTPICYEGVFARVCRALVYQDGRKAADVLINLSNDGWFVWPFGACRWPSTELDQHLAAYVFRAIESRTPVVRAVNTGISGFIDSSGRIEQVLTDEAGRSKMAVAAATRQVLVDERSTVYSRVGDVFAMLCSGATVGLALGLLRGNRALQKKGAPK